MVINHEREGFPPKMTFSSSGLGVRIWRSTDFLPRPLFLIRFLSLSLCVFCLLVFPPNGLLLPPPCGSASLLTMGETERFSLSMLSFLGGLCMLEAANRMVPVKMRRTKRVISETCQLPVWNVTDEGEKLKNYLHFMIFWISPYLSTSPSHPPSHS